MQIRFSSRLNCERKEEGEEGGGGGGGEEEEEEFGNCFLLEC